MCYNRPILEHRHHTILSQSRVLLAEDNVEVRVKFAKMLSLFFCEVIEAANGREALEYFHSKKPDVVITDVRMPGMDGIALVQTIRKTDREIPIIITSAYSDKEYLLESIPLLLVNYLIKPIQHAQLLSSLEQCAELLQQRRPREPIRLTPPYMYDSLNKRIYRAEQEIKLTRKEIALIELLIEHRGHLLHKETIEKHLYPSGEVPASAIKNIMFKLRQKIGNELIETVDQLGYTIA